MQKEKIRRTMDLAMQFIADANRVYISDDPYIEIRGTKATGKLRRISLELTRQLAEMRKP